MTRFQDIVWGDDDEKARLARVAERKRVRRESRRNDWLYGAIVGVAIAGWLYFCLWVAAL